MNIQNLSTTFISNWVLCPRRALRSHTRRLDLGNDNEGTDATRFGTIVHAVMEEMHERLMQHEIGDQDDIEALALESFNRHWSANTCYDFDKYELGSDKIGEFLKRSIMSREGRTVSAEMTFVMDLNNPDHIVIDPPKHRIAAICKEIRERGGVPVVSTIDRIDQVTPTHYEVYDYKTNFLPFTRYEIESSKQLGLYAIAVKRLYPEAETITCVYDMVRHGRFPVEFPQAFLDYLTGYLINLFRQMEKAEEKDFVAEERLNPYCRWCEIRADCTLYKEQLDSPRPTVITENTDMGELFAEYERIGFSKKIIEQREEELKTMFQSKILMDNKGEPLAISDQKEIYLQPNSRSKYDMAGVYNVFKDSGVLVLLKDVASISKQSMDRILKHRPEIKEAVSLHLTKSFVKPSLKSRAIKAGEFKGEDESNEAD
jgi:hypothetical protein